MKLFTFSLIVSLICLQTFSQSTKTTSTQNLIWYGYTNALQFSERTFLVTELHERHFINPFAQHQIAARTHFHYALNEGWETALGICLFLSNSNDPEVDEILIPEARFNLELNQKQKLKKLIIAHRYQVESRFFKNTNSNHTELEDGFYFSAIRFRYRIEATIPIIKLKNDKQIKIKISDEFMLNFGPKIIYNTFDQNRIYTALNIDFTKSLSAEIGYLNSFQKRSTPNDFYMRNIVRLTLFHKINLSKKGNVN